MVVVDDGLKIYLYGAEPLEERLQLAKKAFLAPLPISPVQKEDLIITWLSGLLTTKVFTLTPEELRGAWATMETILVSKRLKALCENRWVCPLSSSFIETLVNLVNSNYDENTQQCAIRVCSSIIANPSLATSVIYSQNHCLTVTKGLIKWIQEGHKSDDDISFTIKIVKELDFHLRSQGDRKVAVQYIVDHLLLPMARLTAALKDDDRKDAQYLVTYVIRMTTNFYEPIFEKRLGNSMRTFFPEGKKLILRKPEATFFDGIASAIRDEPVEVVECLLQILLDNFIEKYHQNKPNHFCFFVILCYMIGVSPSKSACVDTTSHSGIKFQPSEISPARTERLLASLLVVIERRALDMKTLLCKEKLTIWIRKLTQKMLLKSPKSTYGYTCFGILLNMLPQNVANMLIKKFTSLICKRTRIESSKPSPNEEEENSNAVPEESKEYMYLAYEELMCKILKVYNQLRDLPTLIEGLLQGLKENLRQLKDQMIVPDSLIVYEGQLLLPPRFMLEFMKIISSMSHNQILPVWTSIHQFSIKLSPPPKVLLSGNHPGHSQFLTAVIWLYSCIIMTMPLMQAVSVANFASSIGDKMKAVALEVIKPLTQLMLTYPHDNNVCCSILALCHTWGEVHINLLSVDERYTECPDLPLFHPPKPGQPTDFSYLLPFVSSDNWAQISARVANFGDKPTQLALVQLVIQKFSLAAVAENNGSLDETSDEHNGNTFKDAMDGMTKYMVNALDTWGAPVAQMMTFHLAYILPFIDDAHLPSLSVHLVNGIREDQGSWKDYIKSPHFLEASRLHPYVLAQICTVLATVARAKKRKISESEDDTSATANKYSEIMNSLSGVISRAHTLENFQKEEETLKKCGDILLEFMRKRDKVDCPRISSKEISCLLDIIAAFPLAHLQINMHTVMLMLLFTLFVQEETRGKEKNVTAILDAINTTFCAPNAQALFKILSLEDVFLWLLWKRASLPVFIVPEYVLNVSLPYLKFMGSENIQRELSKCQSDAESRKSVAYDHLFSKILKKAARTKAKDSYNSMAEQIVTISATASDVEPFLQVGVIFLSVCFTHGKKMTSAVECLSTWILKIHKKLDVTTAIPAAAACILTGHTVIVVSKLCKFVDIKNILVKKKNPIKRTEGVEEKPKRWQRLLGRTLNLAAICVSSGDMELKRYALTFLTTVSHFALILKEYVPDLFSTVWSILSQTVCNSSDTSTLQVSNISLAPLLSNASEDEYTSWLHELLSNTREDNIGQCGAMWKLVINSDVMDLKQKMKSHAMHNLTYLLLDMVSRHKADDKALMNVVVPALDILALVLSSSVRLAPQVRVLSLIPCTTMSTKTLPVEEFKVVFMATLELLSKFLMVHDRMAAFRMPVILASINHLVILVINQSNQDDNLTPDQIEIMVQCITGVERIVRNLKSFGDQLKRTVHFTIGNIVTSLQQCTVYPAVKTIVESILYLLIDQSDEHCLHHLLTAMPPATIELLRHLQRNYSSVHRFHPFIKT